MKKLETKIGELSESKEEVFKKETSSLPPGLNPVSFSRYLFMG